MDLCKRALIDAGVTAEQIARVCLVGGSTRIPLVRQRLEEVFSAVVHEDIDPDLAVGLGASVQAGLLRGSPVERILVDVTAHSLGVKVIGQEDDVEYDEVDTFAPVLKRNTVLPAVRTEEFYTVQEDQKRVEWELFQGEARRCSENRRVGSFRFDLAPAPAGSAVKCEIAYDLNGVVRVSVSQPGADNAKTVALKLADAGPQAEPRAVATEPGNEGVVVRKARALMAGLSADDRLESKAARRIQAADDEAIRAAAEDELLDLLLALEDDQAGDTLADAPPEAATMGRSDDQDGIGRKIRERLDRSLSRGDPEGAFDALLSIPAGARAPVLGPIAALLRTVVPGLQRQAAWGRLHVLAARAENEPRLLPPPSTTDGTVTEAIPERTLEVRWGLLLACLHARDWARAGRYLTALRPAIDARSPGLGQALAAWVQGAGQIDEAILAPLAAAIPEPPARDPRLGYDSLPRKRAPLPSAPTAEDMVDDQVLALAATQPFLTFAETVLGWQARASPVVGLAIARAAAPIAVREMLLVLARQAGPEEAALLLGRLARQVAADEAVAAELLLGTRLALPVLVNASMDRKTGSALSELAAAATRHPGPQSFVVDWLTGPEPDDRTRAAWLRVAEGLLGGGHGLGGEARLRVWASAMATWLCDRRAKDEPTRLPTWLQATTEKVLESGGEVGPYLRSVPETRRRAVLAATLAGSSTSAATSLLVACWDHVEDDERRLLAAMAVSLIERAQEESAELDLPAEMGDRSVLARLMRAFEDGKEGTPPLLGPAREVWRRIGERAIGYHPELLVWALSECRGVREARRRIEQYRRGRQDVEAILESIRAIAQTERGDCGELIIELERQLVGTFADDPISLGRALKWTRSRGAPARFARSIAQALVEAAGRHPVSSPPPWLAGEVEAASRLVRPKKPRKPRKQRPQAPPKVAATKKGAAGKSGPRPPTTAPTPRKDRVTPPQRRAEAAPPGRPDTRDGDPVQLGLPLDGTVT